MQCFSPLTILKQPNFLGFMQYLSSEMEKQMLSQSEEKVVEDVFYQIGENEKYSDISFIAIESNGTIEEHCKAFAEYVVQLKSEITTLVSLGKAGLDEKKGPSETLDSILLKNKNLLYMIPIFYGASKYFYKESALANILRTLIPIIDKVDLFEQYIEIFEMIQDCPSLSTPMIDTHIRYFSDYYIQRFNKFSDARSFPDALTKIHNFYKLHKQMTTLEKRLDLQQEAKTKVVKLKKVQEETYSKYIVANFLPVYNEFEKVMQCSHFIIRAAQNKFIVPVDLNGFIHSIQLIISTFQCLNSFAKTPEIAIYAERIEKSKTKLNENIEVLKKTVSAISSSKDPIAIENLLLQPEEKSCTQEAFESRANQMLVYLKEYMMLNWDFYELGNKLSDQLQVFLSKNAKKDKPESTTQRVTQQFASLSSTSVLKLEEKKTIKIPKKIILSDINPENNKLLTDSEIHRVLDVLLTCPDGYYSKKSYPLGSPEKKFKYSIIKENGNYYAIYKGKKHGLGSGTFGKVKHAQNLISGEFVVVKVGHGKLDQFINESEILLKLNRLPSYSADNRGKGTYYTEKKYEPHHQYQFKRAIVMRSAGEMNLSDWVYYNKNSITSVLLLQLIVGMVDAVCEVFNSGIIHRDIKGINLVIDEITQRITLVDLGLSVQSDNGFFDDKKPRGTPAYFAPEIFEAAKRLNPLIRYSEKTEVFALGKTIAKVFEDVNKDKGLTSFQYRLMNNFPTKRPGLFETREFYTNQLKKCEFKIYKTRANKWLDKLETISNDDLPRSLVELREVRTKLLTVSSAYGAKALRKRVEKAIQGLRHREIILQKSQISTSHRNVK